MGVARSLIRPFPDRRFPPSARFPGYRNSAARRKPRLFRAGMKPTRLALASSVIYTENHPFTFSPCMVANSSFSNTPTATLRYWSFICTESNHLHNQGTYLARQLWFKVRHKIRKATLHRQMKRSPHFRAMHSQAAQQNPHRCLGSVPVSLETLENVVRGKAGTQAQNARISPIRGIPRRQLPETSPFSPRGKDSRALGQTGEGLVRTRCLLCPPCLPT